MKRSLRLSATHPLHRPLSRAVASLFSVSSAAWLCVSLCLGLCLGFFSAPVLAEIITIDNTSGSGGTVNHNVYGNGTQPDGDDPGLWPASTSGNTVNINSGGTVTGDVYGGFATATATGNTVNINNGGAVTGDVYGGFATMGSGDVFTGNTLNLNSSVSISHVLGFETLNFGNIGTAGINMLFTHPTAGKFVKLNTQGNNIIFGGQIFGSGSGGGIEKQGTGTLTLTNTNNNYGDTRITGGLINFNNVSNFGAGNITLDGGGLQWAVNYGSGGGGDISNRLNPVLGAGGGTLDTNGNIVTLSTDFTGAGGLTIANSSSGNWLTLTGDSNYSGGTTLNSGTWLNIGNGGTTGSITGNVVMGSAMLRFNRSDAITYSGDISGAGALNQMGTGVLTLDGDNRNFNGSIVINNGTLSIASDDNIGSGSNWIYNGTLQLTGANYNKSWSLNSGQQNIETPTGVTATFNGALSGTGGALQKTGAGTLVLTNANTYTGGTVIKAGLINFNNVNNFGSGLITLNGGGLQWATGTTTDISGKLNPLLGTGGGTLDTNGNTVTVSTVLLGAPGTPLTITDSSSGGNGRLTLSGNNNTAFNGNITVTGGTLAISDDDNLGRGTNTLQGGTLELTSTGVYYAKDWTLAATNNAGQPAQNVIKVSGLFTDFLGTLADAPSDLGGGFIKTGTGTLMLYSANTYTGLTEVREGALQLVNSGKISDSLALHGGTSLAVSSTANSPTLTQLDVHGNSSGSAKYYGDLNLSNGTLNVYVPYDIGNGDTLLSVFDNSMGTGNVNLNGATVHVGINGGTPTLQVGQSINLIDAEGTLSANGVDGSTVVALIGSTQSYTFLLLKDGSNKLIATASGLPPGGGGNSGGSGGNSGGGNNSARGLLPTAKALSEGYLAGTAFLSRGNDFLTGKGLSALREQTRANITGWQGFAALSGGSLRHHTGSHINTDGAHLLAGVAGSHRFSTLEATLGAFLETGDGNYNSHNTFASASVKGKGDTRYTGLGLLGQTLWSNGVYLEGSLHSGYVRTSYHSSDLRNILGHTAHYRTRSQYVGAHIGLGKRHDLTETLNLDLYTQGLWTQQGSDRTTLSTGERLKFESVTSERLKVGARLSQGFTPTLSGYLGVAVEREFDGKAKATVDGLAIPAPKLKGTSGVFDLGLRTVVGGSNSVSSATLKPGSFYFDLGVQGYSGKRTGVTASLRVNYLFQ